MRKLLLTLLLSQLCGAVFSQSGPETLGQWSDPLTSSNGKWPNDVAVHMSLLPTGKVLLWGRGVSHVNKTNAYIWNPSTEVVEASNLQTGSTNLFCSSTTMMANGRVIVVSGHSILDTVDGAVVDVNIFNQNTNAWSRVADLNYRRWYPTTISLPDGNIITVSGSDYMSGSSHSPTNFGVPQVEKYNTVTGTWGTVSMNTAPNWYDYYPFLHVAPNGQIFNAGASVQTKFITINGMNGTITKTLNRYYNTVRDYGSSAMIGSKVITLGGGQTNQDMDPVYTNNRPDPNVSLSSNTAETIDLAASNPTWSPVSSLYNRRRHANATILPDGTLAVTGGTQWFSYGSGSPEELTGWTDFTPNRLGDANTLAAEVANASLPDGRLEEYIISPTGIVYRSEQTSINGPFIPFYNMGFNGTASRVAIKRHGDNSADLVVMKSDGTLWVDHYDPSTNLWSGFNTPWNSGIKGKRFALTAYADKRLDIYMIDFNQNLCRAEQTSVNGPFTNFTMIGSTANLAIDIAAVRHKDGTADLVFAGIDNNMWLGHYDPVQSPPWAGFTLVGTVNNKAQRISMTTMQDETLVLVMEGMDGNMWHTEKANPSVAWTGWALVANAGNKATSVSVCRRLDNYFDVTMGGLDNAVWRSWNFGPVYQAEIYNPANNTWAALSSMTIPRMYHSTALLLPDGRVLTAGGGQGGGGTGSANHPNAQIFSPPYLFRGPRPVISSNISVINYGGTFPLAYSANGSVSNLSLVSLGSVTHSYNTSQRFVPLSFSNSSGGLTVTAPANANQAPPGFYMLFLIDNNGVPSIGKIVQVYDAANPPAMASIQDSLPRESIVVRDSLGIANDSRLTLLGANSSMAVYTTQNNETMVVATSGLFDPKGILAEIADAHQAIVLRRTVEKTVCRGGKGDQCECPQTTDIDIRGLAEGKYTVTLTTPGKTPVKAGFIKQATRFIVYPNPAGNQLTVAANRSSGDLHAINGYNLPVRAIERIGVFDFSGRKVLEKIMPSGVTGDRVDLSSLRQGTYIVRIEGGGLSEEHKIIVVH